ncbi:MAG: helix-turn-helix transcriptional regulator [Thermodesulfobacteriota bacterium]
MLSNKDMHDVLRVGHACLACQSVDELRNAALDLFEPVFGYHSANFFLTRIHDGRLDLDGVVCRGITQENLRRFREYYYRLDPFLKHFPPPASVLTMDQVTRPGRLERSEYYTDFLRPQDIHHQLTISVKTMVGVVGVVALFRPARQEDFTDKDRTLAGLITTFLSGALEKTINVDRSAILQHVMKGLAARKPCEGIAVVDHSLKLRYMNEEAERVLAAAGGLPEEIVDACRRLLEMAGPDPVGEPPDLDFLLTGPRLAEPLAVRIQRLERVPDPPLILVCLGTGPGARGWLGRIRDKGISRRELEVIYLVVQGLTNVEVGRRLFISEHTVENHLKSIFRKIGVRNRASLVGALAQLPFPRQPS